MNCTISVAKTRALISFAITGADAEADLRLKFRICTMLVLSLGGSIIKQFSQNSN